MSEPPTSKGGLVPPSLTVLAPAAAADETRLQEPRWRSILRRGLPVIGVLLVVVLLAIVFLYVYDSNRRGALALSNDLISSIDHRVSVQLQAYLAPAEQFLDLEAGVTGARGVFEGGAAAEQFALQALPKIGPVTGFDYGDAEGNFLYVVRNSLGGYDTKTVDRRGGGHRVSWVRRDAHGAVTETGEDPNDKFDPRERPWYKGAEAARKSFWTDTYLFFTVHKPGITFSVPQYDEKGALKAVLGVDIELATLCTFLKQLTIGTTGRAIVIERTGRIVAYPSDNWLPADRPDVVAPLLDELGDSILTRAYNRLRVEGYGHKIIDIDNRRIIVSTGQVNLLADRRWVVLIVVPESDFIGFVTNSSWVALAVSIVMVLVVAALAGLLAWRSLLAERRAAAADIRQQALEMRTQAITDLARQTTVDVEVSGNHLHQVTENAAAVCRAKRAAVWHLGPDGRILRCIDCFDRGAGEHTSGLELHRDELPNLFATLSKGESIDTIRTGRDRRTSELFALYLDPLGIGHVYVAPIAAGSRALGMLTIEDPRIGSRTAGMTAFCDGLASLLALRFSAAASLAAAPSAPVSPVATSVPRPAVEAKKAEDLANRRGRLQRTLLHHDISTDGLGDNLVDVASVGVIKFPDWTSMAKRPTDSGQRTIMDVVVHEIRQTIEKSGVTYAGFLDDLFVLAAFSTEKEAITVDAHRVAQAILDVRDRLAELEEKWDLRLDYRLAIDVGSIMNSAVATEPPSRNVWGNAVGVAKVLAESTGRRAISVSESAYELLSDVFLFRPRGSYFLPEIGTMRLFVLVGRV
jgi:adenylate cyclase